MKYIKTFSHTTIFTAAGLGILLASGLSGCGNQEQNNQSAQEQAKKGAFVIIEETAEGKYKIKEEFPSDETRIVLKQLDGTEKVLSKEEMDKLIKEEEIKIDNNTSNLTNPQNAQVSGHGMSLGEAILASAAGAIIGSWIGSKLFGNQNYQQNRQAGYKSPSTYSKSVDSFKKSGTSTSTSNTKSGFFGGKSTASSSSGSFGTKSGTSSSSRSFGG
ncbi:MAG: UPF0323 family lipoprotein [Campylobacterales bacterium]|nr:UPF0323 family lipoprotein [Campylobacterales bacterium]